MTMQSDLFEESAKKHGMEFAAQGHEGEIMACRDMAIKLLAMRGEITIDDLRAAMPRMQFGNWAGSIFKDPKFICTGFKPARHLYSHGRVVRKWALREFEQKKFAV